MASHVAVSSERCFGQFGAANGGHPDRGLALSVLSVNTLGIEPFPTRFFEARHE
jgi:hypothetical protein